MTHIVEFVELNLLLTVITLVLGVIAGLLAVLAGRRFAGDIGRGFNFLVLGGGVMALSFLFGLDDHLHTAGAETLLAHPGWVHGSTTILALIFFLIGFLIIYKAALRAAKE
ncbi:MAG: hypothetical protein HYU39_04885 [Thaumarchaeota archaeon]|nr:hypothetical protein [Nitrososphaerota archaeon]